MLTSYKANQVEPLASLRDMVTEITANGRHDFNTSRFFPDLRLLSQ